MSIQGSDYGFSTSERPLLQKLVDDDVLVIRQCDDLNKCVVISEACDDWYCTVLTTDELRALAQELIAVADIVDSGSEP